MNIAIVGSGYVGLVSGVCYADKGHSVTCIDTDSEKINKMSQGLSPIYEPGLEARMVENIALGRLKFTVDYRDSIDTAEIVVISVGTPCNPDGTADISFVENAAIAIAQRIKKYCVIVIKSTVPVGTNDHIENIIRKYLIPNVEFDVVSNPEFLREGSAVEDTFKGDRIVIGSSSSRAIALMKELHDRFQIPYFITDRRSAEMVKYAANAFLATKISFINEIATICEKVGADIQDVAAGMGKDKRIGELFLQAGIGYGGSCFPKDTNALMQLAGNVEHNFELLRSVIKVNNQQQQSLVQKAKQYFGDVSNLTIAVLGLSFKPNTNDMREAPSLVVTEQLILAGAKVVAYDPITISNAKTKLNPQISYASSVKEALLEADCAMILTEWEEIKNIDLSGLPSLMKRPVLFDGRNCFSLAAARRANIDYISIGRPAVTRNRLKEI